MLRGPGAMPLAVALTEGLGLSLSRCRWDELGLQALSALWRLVLVCTGVSRSLLRRPTFFYAAKYFSSGKVAAIPQLEFDAGLDDIAVKIRGDDNAVNYGGLALLKRSGSLDPHAYRVEAFDSVHLHWDSTMQIFTEHEPASPIRTMLSEVERESCDELCGRAHVLRPNYY